MSVKIDVSNYEIETKVFLGYTLRIIFKHKSENTRKTLELVNVAGFLEGIAKPESISWIRIHHEPTTYTHDVALRLKKPQLKNYKETYLFEDRNCVSYLIRISSQNSEFRDWHEKDSWF